MKRFALIGEPLGHSLSPALHKAIYRQLEIDDASYRTVELPEQRLKSFFTGFRVGGFDGINITVPHKHTVLNMIDEIDPRAKSLDAINCIHRIGNKLIGHNTDVLGFEYSLEQNDVKVEGNEFVILGAGGSAQAVGQVLAEGEAKRISIFNRTVENAEALKLTIESTNPAAKVVIVDEEQLISRSKQIDCVINTTTVGMHPNTKESPINEDIFTTNTLAFDLIYNPVQSKFLKSAENMGASTINGMQMLVAQAVYSVEIWMGGNIVAHVDMNALIRDMEKSIT